MCAHECKEFFTCSLMSFNCCCSFSSLCASTAFGEPPESFAADSVRAVFVIVGLFEMFVDAKLKEERPFLVRWSCFLLWFWFFSLVWFTLVWLGLVCSGLFYILQSGASKVWTGSKMLPYIVCENHTNFSVIFVIFVIHLICQADSATSPAAINMISPRDFCTSLAQSPSWRISSMSLVGFLVQKF